MSQVRLQTDMAPSRAPLRAVGRKSNASAAGRGASGGAGLLPWLRLWDSGTRSQRLRMLDAFTASNRNRTGPQLELEYGDGASLLLARLSAWLRLTYLLGLGVQSLLAAISIFVAESNGSRFLAEFVETGGVITALDILAVDALSEADKCAALQLLHHVASAGRRYRELLCRHNGALLVASALVGAQEEPTQAAAQLLLVNLGRSNHMFATHVLVTALTALRQVNDEAVEAEADGTAATLNSAQCRAAQATRALFSSTHEIVNPPGAPRQIVGARANDHGERNAFASLARAGVGAGVAMLRSSNLTVQDEANALLKLLRALCTPPPNTIGAPSGAINEGVSCVDDVIARALCEAMDAAAHATADEIREENEAEAAAERNATSSHRRKSHVCFINTGTGDGDYGGHDGEGEHAACPRGGKDVQHVSSDWTADQGAASTAPADDDDLALPLAPTLADSMQQGAASKFLATFVADSDAPDKCARACARAGAVPVLLCALANRGSYEAQRHAADALNLLISVADEEVSTEVDELLGAELAQDVNEARTRVGAVELSVKAAEAVVMAVRAKRDAVRTGAETSCVKEAPRLSASSVPRQSVAELVQVVFKETEAGLRTTFEAANTEGLTSKHALRNASVGNESGSNDDDANDGSAPQSGLPQLPAFDPLQSRPGVAAPLHTPLRRCPSRGSFGGSSSHVNGDRRASASVLGPARLRVPVAHPGACIAKSAVARALKRRSLFVEASVEQSLASRPPSFANKASEANKTHEPLLIQQGKETAVPAATVVVAAAAAGSDKNECPDRAETPSAVSAALGAAAPGAGEGAGQDTAEGAGDTVADECYGDT